ncbi:protein decapping 5-like [Rhododendron vialii]|uniref:protein decapping 5-like n=1 Tax=Rhododendron vialii TaxID=182163 RepID=UPI00265F06E9|nr:protein decapping 5-like [Rhododendron vialii]
MVLLLIYWVTLEDFGMRFFLVETGRIVVLSGNFSGITRVNNSASTFDRLLSQKLKASRKLVNNLEHPLTPDIPNDPAIIQAHYPCSTSPSSSYLSASATPPINISSSAHLGHPNSISEGILSLDQPVKNLRSWDSFLPPPTENGNGITIPTYWPDHIGFSGGVSQMQSPAMNVSLPSDTSTFAQFSHPLLPTVGTSCPYLTFNMPLPLPLPTSVPTIQSATLPPNLDVNPVLPPVVDRSKSSYETVSQSKASIDGSSSLVHSELSMPSLLTPVHLFPLGPPGESSSHLQTSSGFSVFVFLLNKTVARTHHVERDNIREKGNSLKGDPLCSHHVYRVQRGRANRPNGASLHPHEKSMGNSQCQENGEFEFLKCFMPNTAAVHTHSSYRSRGRGKGNQITIAVHIHHSYRGRGPGKGNQVSFAKSKFTEDFDFEAMNEKFNKEEIWGHLGRSKKIGLEDHEGDVNDNGANKSEEEDEVKTFYVKDDFFDSLSCNSLNHELVKRRAAKLSEQRRIDIEVCCAPLSVLSTMKHWPAEGVAISVS